MTMTFANGHMITYAVRVATQKIQAIKLIGPRTIRAQMTEWGNPGTTINLSTEYLEQKTNLLHIVYLCFRWVWDNFGAHI